MSGQLMNKVEMDVVRQWYDKHKNYQTVADLVCKKYDLPVVGSHIRYWLTRPEPQEVKQKILLFDIETSPIIAYVWGTYQQNVSLSQIKQDWQVLMFAAKWLDEDDVLYASQNCKIKGNGTEQELDVIQEMWKLLDEADIVVAHNAKNFDVKKMNAKFLEYGLDQPSHYKVVDTLSIARYNFGLTSNKLDYIAKLLQEEGKNNTNFQLWIDCMYGDQDAWNTMLDYCIQDVRVLERVYLKLRAWDKRHPKVSFGAERACNVCSGRELVYVQDHHTAASTFEIYQCAGCGHQQRSRVNIANLSEKKNREVSL